MRKSLMTVLAGATLLALAVPVLAGGFWLVTGNPEASTEARAHNAVLTIKTAGCGDPAHASINASAITVVNGRRQAMPLKLIPLSEAGVYAVTRQWPAEGRWVLRFVATDHDRVTSTLVAAGPDGIERDTAKLSMSQPSLEDEAALLNTPASIARK